MAFGPWWKVWGESSLLAREPKKLLFNYDNLGMVTMTVIRDPERLGDPNHRRPEVEGKGSPRWGGESLGSQKGRAYGEAAGLSEITPLPPPPPLWTVWTTPRSSSTQTGLQRSCELKSRQLGFLSEAGNVLQVQGIDFPKESRALREAWPQMEAGGRAAFLATAFKGRDARCRPAFCDQVAQK